MQLKTVAELSDAIVSGLVQGKIIRQGGVLHSGAKAANSGVRIVAWLRESGVGPTAPDTLAAGMGALAAPLGLIGAVPSILSLGATVGFGKATLERLSQVNAKLDRNAQSVYSLHDSVNAGFSHLDTKLDAGFSRLDARLHQVIERLDEIGAKIDRLQWTVELGFVNILSGLEQIVLAQEIEIVANLKSAAKLAWEAQILAPGSPQRIARLENALTLATVATEQLVLRTEQEIEAAITFFKTATPRNRLSIPDRTLTAMNRFRQACSASATRAAIVAETASPKAAVGGLQQDVTRLQRQLNRIGHSFLRGTEPGDTSPKKYNYDDLLNSQWHSKLPAARIVRWAKRFDPNLNDWSSILDSFRTFNAGGRNRQRPERPQRHEALTYIHESVNWSPESQRNLPVFADLLDGAWEDCDRLSGYVAEYATAEREGLSIGEYRDVLALSDLVSDRSLAFLCRVDK